MKLVTYSEGQRAERRLGAVVGDDVVDVNRLYGERLRRQGEARWAPVADALLPSAMRPFLEGGDATMRRAREVIEEVSAMLADGRQRAALAAAGAVHPRASVTLHPPVPDPRKIVCLGLNYRDHAEECGLEIPKEPILFAKFASCLQAPGGPIVLPAVSQQVDYEVELCVVVGRRAKNVRPEAARDYVAGYTIFHDVSARDYQFHTSQWTAGKNFDTFGPCGPALVTADEVEDPHVLDVSLSINGRTMQRSNTRNLIFDVWQTIAYVSTVLTLEPGDLIPTGTPGGVGFTRKPQVFLKPGDLVRLEIARLGVLENPVVAEGRGA